MSTLRLTDVQLIEIRVVSINDFVINGKKIIYSQCLDITTGKTLSSTPASGNQIFQLIGK